MRNAALAGAALAVLMVILLGVGGYTYLQRVSRSDIKPTDRVVLIFEGPAADGATVAALVSVVADGRMVDVSPDTSVTVPGTAAGTLADAFVFGGGASVARAVASKMPGTWTAYVTVPESVWRAALGSASGVTVSVPDTVTVFDGVSLITVPSGEQKLTGSATGALLRSLSYLSPARATALRLQLERQLADGLVAAGSPAGSLVSDLSVKARGFWITNYLSKAETGQAQ